MTSIAHKSWFFPALLIFVWLVAIAIINPFGEFPINDDWAYAKNVYELSVKNKFYVSEWPAMTLVSQTLYGYLVSKIFGFSFSALRLSILFLAIISSLVFYLLLKKRCNNDLLAFLFTIGFCFSPMFCTLAFTFQTDIFFLSFIIFSVYALECFFEKKKAVYYILYCLFCLIAVLNRQQGFLLPLLIFIPLVWTQKFKFINLILALLPFAICLGGHFGYISFLKSKQIVAKTWGLDLLIDNLKKTSYEVKQWQTGDMLLVSGFALLPLGILLIWKLKKQTDKNYAALFLKTFIIAVLLFFLCWPALKRFPGGIFQLNNLGPRSLKDYFENTVNRFVTPDWIQWLVRALAFLSIFPVFFVSSRKKEEVKNENNFNKTILISFVFFLFAYGLFVALNDVYFDRYLLPFILFLFLVKTPDAKNFGRSVNVSVALAVFFIFLFSVLSQSDYMNWQRTRWKAISDLNKEGINEHFIDGGFEFNGWFHTASGYTLDGRSWWWVDRDDYLISNGHYPGFWKRDYYVYQHLLPYEKDTIFVLEKIVKRNFEDSYAWVKKEVLKSDSLIRTDKGWVERMAVRAAKTNTTVDSMIRLDAVWMSETLKSPYKTLNKRE